MRKITILGSTGSIGRKALEMISCCRDRFKVVGLAANSNIRLLRQQIRRFRPQYVAVGDARAAEAISRKNLYVGREGIKELLRHLTDVVLVAIPGSRVIDFIFCALGATRVLALANKEALVMAGDLIMKAARRRGVKIIPVDSEQSAIFQCLQGRPKKDLDKVYLTASGGPLHGLSRRMFPRVTVEQATSHPRWPMGRKISVDSATLMNKGLELIEAMRLFDLKADDIEVVIHPQAIVHSMVRFIDGVVLAQLSVCDMGVPIQYALTHPLRIKSHLAPLDFVKTGRLDFSAPDIKKYPCLRLARAAARAGGAYPCVLNAANEVAVEAFLGGKISFNRIPRIVEDVLSRHREVKNSVVNSPLRISRYIDIDGWARQEAKCFL
ncbi:MAG: 1-deoxy-D-xylulose-5-phosphate reductoisomerase [Candidatus Omnitrophota bacterium]